jgi:multicomponent Na+:H+ antiporter subunit B
MATLALLNVFLFAVLLATAVAITRIRALYVAAMLAALFSLVLASLFVMLDAVDVAFTEAAVGAGVSTVLFLSVLALTRSREAVTPRRRRWPAGLVVLLAGGTLLFASQDLPPFGAPDTPVQRHPVTEVYLEDSAEQIGIPNTVTSVLASYRGYDTLGELVVIFTAGVAVLLLLTRLPHPTDPAGAAEPAALARYPGRASVVLADYRVLRVVSKLLMPFILLFACYVLFHGEYGPGGGFQAGMILAAGVILFGLVFGLDVARRVLPRPVLLVLVAAGVLLYAGVGVADLLLGGAFLDYDVLRPGNPQGGQQIGILLVETGVGITVAAVMTAVFFSFAGRGVSR